MSAYRYASEELRADYIRAAAGLVLTGSAMLFVPSGTVLHWILLAFFGLFGVFGCRTWLRGKTGIETDTEAIMRPANGLPKIYARRVRWDELRKLKLRYFSVKRDRSEGWMQLKIAGGGSSLAVDSTLVGFEEIVGLAVIAAEANKLDLDGNTRANLAALGHRYDQNTAGQAAAS